MKSKMSLLLLPLFAVACESAEQIESEPAAEMAATEPSTLARVQPGTIFAVELDQPLGTSTASQVGEAITATTVEALETADGTVAIPAGAKVEGTVAAYRAAGDGLPAMVAVEFEQVVDGGRSYPISGQVVHVDLSQATGQDHPGGIVGADHAEPLHPGMIVADAGSLMRGAGNLPPDAMAIALGGDASSGIPQGARLTVEFDPSASR
jgi:hypothetical protein